MGKKRKHSESSDEELGTKRIKEELFSDESMSIANNVNNISINENPDLEVFLIKKPIEMGLGDLGILQWATDGGEEILSRSKIKLETGQYRALVAPRTKKQRLVHIPAIRQRAEEDALEIPAQNFINAAITILPVEVKPKTLGGSIYEEGEGPALDAEIHPGLRKIKKTAVLKLETRQQRNKAYGTTTDLEGSPRKLINIFQEKLLTPKREI